MTRNNESPEDTIQRLRRLSADSPDNGARREPAFSRFDDLHEDGYEEPDRDTDFASGYRADSVDDEQDYDDAYAGDDEHAVYSDDEADDSDDNDSPLAEDTDDWPEQENGYDDAQGNRQGWPLGLIMVGVLAVVLLAAGGYGVLQQRAATETELQELRAALAVAGNPADAGATRGALDTLQQAYDKLAAQAEALTLENRRLTDTVAGLEAQLGDQQSVPGAVAKAQADLNTGAVATTPAVAASSAAPAPPPATTPKPEASRPSAPPATPLQVAAASPASTVATSRTGPWFVNFGTYATRSMADTWASRVRPGAGQVIVAPNEKDGRTLYRVRVVGLADREQAQQVARSLEADLRVAELWVGRE